MERNRRDFLRGGLCLGAATAAWTAGAHRLLALPSPRPTGSLPPWVTELLEAALLPWEGGTSDALAHAGATNREWDFMGRTFLGLALANLALRDPAGAPRYLAALDAVVADTMRVERTHGFPVFLMPYGQRGGWVRQPPASVFVDGEIAAVLAARCLAAPSASVATELRDRLEVVSAAMRAGPVLSAESYPDECWTFCNTFALAALKLGEAAGVVVDPGLPDAWVRSARGRLVEGLLPSSFRLSGAVLDGPEGSSLWVSAHNLQLVDAELAEAQYRLARRALFRRVAGFGYALEWPAGAGGFVDVDSGPVVPLLGASPGSSGLALVGARAFGDRAAYDALSASLELAAFPEVRDGRRRYLASNAVGDAVLLYSAVQGPLWAHARRVLA